MKVIIGLLLAAAALAQGPIDLDALWDLRQPRESEKKFRATLQENRFTQSGEWALELKTQIARALALQKNFDGANKVLEEVEARLKAGEQKKAEVRYLLETGRVLYYQRKEAEPRIFFTKAFELALERGLDYQVLDAANMLGIVDESLEKRNEWKRKALEFAEASKVAEARGWLGLLRHDYAWVKFDGGKKEEALALFQKSAEAMKAEGNGEGERSSRWCAAKVLRLLGRTHEALREQQRLERDFQRLGLKDCFVLEELAEIYVTLGEKEKAGRYFKEAYHLLSQDAWMIAEQKERLARLKKLAGMGFSSQPY